MLPFPGSVYASLLACPTIGPPGQPRECDSGQIDNVERPYKFITFDTFIQKTKKLYTDTRANRNHIKMMYVTMTATLFSTLLPVMPFR